MSSRLRCLPDFESRSVALFATLTRGRKAAGAATRQSGVARKPVGGLRPYRKHEPSVEPELQRGAAPDKHDKDGAISSAGCDEPLE